MDGHDLKADLRGYAAGLRADVQNMPAEDQAWWAAHCDRVERAARDAERIDD
jgi:hypothetical protein